MFLSESVRLSVITIPAEPIKQKLGTKILLGQTEDEFAVGANRSYPWGRSGINNYNSALMLVLYISVVSLFLEVFASFIRTES